MAWVFTVFWEMYSRSPISRKVRCVARRGQAQLGGGECG
jgi:hypothetical protein